MKMNKQGLKYKLDQLGIYPGFYSLNGDLLPDKIVLYQNYHKWEVFYFDERGNREKFHAFESESEACNYIYSYFKNSKTVR